MPRLIFQDGIDEAANASSQLPEGWYPGYLVNSYFKDFKKGNGVSLVFDLAIKHNGHVRKVMAFNTWKHQTSDEAEKYGQIAVKKFMRACGKPDSLDTEEAENIFIEIRVVQGDKYNQVKGYRPRKREIPTENLVKEEVVTQHSSTFDDDDVPF